MSAMTMLALNESYERAGVAFAEGLARIGDISQIWEFLEKKSNL